MPWWSSKDKEEPLLNEKTGEDTSLLGERSAGAGASRSSASLMTNFVAMATMFSITHGCVVSCLSYASAELGSDMGAYGSFTLMFVYAFGALFLSKPVTAQLGGKWALFAGLAGYCIYVGGFLFAIIVKSGSPALAWAVYISTCIVGGLSGGLLWTAQGRYFANNSRYYSNALANEVANESAPAGTMIEDTEIANCNAKFAGIFASTYLGVEALTKVSATVIFLTCGNAAAYIVFTVYCGAALVGTFLFVGCSDLGDRGNGDVTFDETIRGVGDAIQLLKSDIRLFYMMPYQWAFGITAAFISFYVMGTIIAGSDSLGDTWVGLLSAIITITGASMGMPVAYISARIGKSPVMVFGAICMGFCGFITYLVSDDTLGTWGWIIPYLMVFGMGRGAWENTNKAVIADLYVDAPHLSTSAFANVNFNSGISGAFAYVVFEYAGRNVMSTVVVVSAVLAMGGFYQAMVLNADQLEQKNDSERSEDPIEA